MNRGQIFIFEEGRRLKGWAAGVGPKAPIKTGKKIICANDTFELREALTPYGKGNNLDSINTFLWNQPIDWLRIYRQPPSLIRMVRSLWRFYSWAVECAFKFQIPLCGCLVCWVCRPIFGWVCSRIGIFINSLKMHNLSAKI
jgi:hypothetical protein